MSCPKTFFHRYYFITGIILILFSQSYLSNLQFCSISFKASLLLISKIFSSTFTRSEKEESGKNDENIIFTKASNGAVTYPINYVRTTKMLVHPLLGWTVLNGKFQEKNRNKPRNAWMVVRWLILDKLCRTALMELSLHMSLDLSAS